MTLEKKLYTVDEVIGFISQGLVMSLAGDIRVLENLPSGNWIAGSTPYFMDDEGGKFNQELIFVTHLNTFEKDYKIDFYDENNIDQIIEDSFENGYTILIIPPFQKVYEAYAMKTQNMIGLYNNPIIGWVSGVDLYSEKDIAKTYYGPNGKSYTNLAVAIHVKLPNNFIAEIDIINIFDGTLESDEIQFYEDGFSVTNCLINGTDANFSEYIVANGLDLSHPLVANYSGVNINVSIRDVENDKVNLYAPVFKDFIYHFPKQITDYKSEFKRKTKNQKPDNDFSCNCLFNYIYGALEGEKIKNVVGPIAFGEIGYKLLNQTLVNLKVYKI